MYDPKRVELSRVVAPPYDVITAQDQRHYYDRDPHNVVRLISGQVYETDTADDNKYLRAARFFNDWLSEGVLRREAVPTLYLYRHSFIDPTNERTAVRQGILGVVQLEPFGDGILPHERTHARAKADRLSLTRAVQANLSPIFSMYEDADHVVRTTLEELTRRPAPCTIQGREGESHAIWSISDSSVIERLERALDRSRLYVADGHHRYETALNFRNKMQAEHPEAPPDAAFNFVLMLLVDAEDPGLVILPTHRVVHDLEGFDAENFMEKVRMKGRLIGREDRGALMSAMHAPTDTHRIGLALPTTSAYPLSGARGKGLEFFTLDIPRKASQDPVGRLDVSVLHGEILEDVLGLSEKALEEERFVSYSRNLDLVIERVEAGGGQAAFLLRPPAVADVIAVASAGRVMPQKSTYFYPKPASGIVFNPLDPEIRIPAV
jgi:uncharacterized protein (DUF1015 family)